ncbi:MAG: aldolase catalytic domain-containing protein [Sulfurovaceae bacterium]|nr:aldolase catalytic domain-containing protein [Sulfurovaceae bacterium]
MLEQDIKVFDCTIRDGGLVNNYHFTDEFVKGVYQTCLNAGIDYMEIGKNNSPTLMSDKEFGAWNFSKEEDIRRIVGNNDTDMKIAVMSDIGRTVKEELLPKEKSVIDMIRIATYIHQIPEAIELITEAHAKGYETTVNIMAVAQSSDREIDKALEEVSKTDVDVIYLADTFGSYHPQEIRELTKKYLDIAKANGKEVGIHAHNNIQLAYANTIEAMENGVNFLDCTISGLGRGAGNCPTELLINYLKNLGYKQLPILKFVEEFIVPLEKELDWGYSIPYMITGQLVEHPRSAIKARKEDDTNHVDFYYRLVEKD